MCLRTVLDARGAVLRQADRWWGARLYHCPVCDRDFAEDVAAARHVVDRQHPVLRWDQRGCWPLFGAAAGSASGAGPIHGLSKS